MASSTTKMRFLLVWLDHCIALRVDYWTDKHCSLLQRGTLSESSSLTILFSFSHETLDLFRCCLFRYFQCLTELLNWNDRVCGWSKLVFHPWQEFKEDLKQTEVAVLSCCLWPIRSVRTINLKFCEEAVYECGISNASRICEPALWWKQHLIWVTVILDVTCWWRETELDRVATYRRRAWQYMSLWAPW